MAKLQTIGTNGLTSSNHSYLRSLHLYRDLLLSMCLFHLFSKTSPYWRDIHDTTWDLKAKVATLQAKVAAYK